MSKSSCLLPMTVLLLLLFAPATAQDLNITIKIEGQSARIAGRYLGENRRKNPENLTFLDRYAGISGLADRFKNVLINTGDVDLQAPKRFNAAEYVSQTGTITGWTYDVDLRANATPTAAAHISWLSNAVGILMLDDLLPQQGTPIGLQVKIEVPEGWSIFTTATASGDGKLFDVPDVEKASFVVGRNLRQYDAGDATVILGGPWQFSDKDAASVSREILAHYNKTLGALPSSKTQIAVLKFPTDIQSGQWEAETRGTTITVLSSDTPFASQSLQRLHEQLRHEIFHLWFPNAVNLSGNYDWFYEGFALYQSLKLGVAVNRIRYDDYLDTLSRAINIDRSGSRRISLIDASTNRFGGNETRVYARGMLVAFLCDLALLESSKGKRSTDDLVREIFEKHKLDAPRADGNDAILGIMSGYPPLKAIADRYITGAEPIDWSALLSAAGLEATVNGRETVLKTVAKPRGRQKDLLNRLGYNNWRKLTSK